MMATCPDCLTNSRTGTFRLEPTGKLHAIGPAMLAGMSVKYAAVAAYRLTCRCGWSVVGHIDGERLLACVDCVPEGPPGSPP